MFNRRHDDVVDALEAALAKARDELYELGRKAYTGQSTVEAILERDISYYDMSKLEYAEQVAYKGRAEELLKNETLQNEVNFLLADWIKVAARDAEDFARVRDMRVAMSALEVLMTRLQDIPDPRARRQTNEGQFDAI